MGLWKERVQRGTSGKDKVCPAIFTFFLLLRAMNICLLYDDSNTMTLENTPDYNEILLQVCTTHRYTNLSTSLF